MRGKKRNHGVGRIDQLEQRRLLSSAVFASTTPITTPVFGHADPYPSTIDVTGMAGTITRVTVTLAGISHTYPDDYDILLIGPRNQSLILMSDIGGGEDTPARTLTFDDDAATFLPNEGPFESGTYKPTNIGASDSFSPPVLPIAPTGTTLSVFNGTDANGAWKLYVMDDFPDDTGIIAQGWSVAIDTAPIDPPTVSAVTPAMSAMLTSKNADIDVTFSDAVVGVETSDLILSGAASHGASIDSVALLNGNTWRFSVSNLSEGLLGLSLAPDVNDIEIASGTDVPNTPWTYRVDFTPPLASVAGVTPNPRSDAVGQLTLSFSEDVTGVDLSDFTLTRDGSPVSLQNAGFTVISASQYALDLTSATALTGSYTLKLNAATSGITDVAGNALATNSSTSWLMNAVNGTAAADQIRLIRQSPASQTVNVFINNATATPDYSFSLAGFGANLLRMLAGDGDDVVTLDFATGAPAPTGGVQVDSGEGFANALIVAGTSSNDAAVASLGKLTLNGSAINYANIENVRFDGGSGNDSLTVAQGNYLFTQDASLTNAHLAVTVESGATATFAASQHLAGLTLYGDATLTPDDSKVLVTSALAVASDARLDLGDGAMIVDYAANSPVGSWTDSNYTGITGWIRSGRNGGSWDGPGLVTSMPAAILPSMLMTLGVVESTAARTWHGESVDASAVLVAYTFAGDNDLNGTIDGDDYFRADYGCSSKITGYCNGDIDLNGRINADDYFLIDSNYNKAQGAPPAGLSETFVPVYAAQITPAARGDASTGAYFEIRDLLA